MCAAIRENLRLLEKPAIKAAALVLLLLTNAVMPVAHAALLRSSLDALYVMDAGLFVRSCMALVAAYLAAATMMGASAALRFGVIEDVATGQRRRIVRSALAMPFIKFEKSSRGDLISRLTADVDQSSRIFTAVYLTLDITLRATAAIFYMVCLNWQVGVATIASSLILVWVTRRTNASLPAKSKAYQKSLGELSSTALNSLEGVTVVKSFSAEDTVSRPFSMRTKDVFAAAIALAKSTQKMRAAATLAAFLPLVTAFAYGGYMSVMGLLSAGSVLAMLNLTDSISILVNLGPRWSEVQRSAGAYERVRAAMTAEADSTPGSLTSPAQDAAAIRVNHLSFEYEPGYPVLSDVSFEVPSGGRVAIVGKSGCGKSTLLKLICGVYAPAPGTVLVNGLDMHYERLTRGRNQIAYVPQEPFLLSGSVRENILLASEAASDDDLKRALDAADSSLFIDELRDGVDSQVGEKGSLLSGGQRQRLCLARGLLRDAPVLLLDEPTSSLDGESEARVVEAMSRMHGLTCLTVTHRARVAEASDLILVMDGGRVVESGTHSELMSSRSLYWSFYSGETTFSPLAAVAVEGRGSR